MDSRRILVIGATGHIGRFVVAQLGAAGRPVRAMTRTPDAAALPSSVEVVHGDLTRPDTLDRCLDDVDTAFLVWTAPPAAAPAALARIAAHVRRLVFLTSPIKTPHPFFQQPNPARDVVERIEHLVETSGMDWTFIRAGIFAGNARHFWGPQIRAGQIVRWPCLDVETAPTDERDIAAVAVRILCEPGHAGAEYVVTGPQSLTQAQQIQTLGRAIGRPIRIEEIGPAEARSELLPILRSPVFIDTMLAAWAAARGQPAYVTSTCYHVTGAPAHTFQEWAMDYASEFMPADNDPAEADRAR